MDEEKVILITGDPVAEYRAWKKMQPPDNPIMRDKLTAALGDRRMDEEKIRKEVVRLVTSGTSWSWHRAWLHVLKRECLRARIDEVIFRGNHNVAYLARLRAELAAMEKDK